MDKFAEYYNTPERIKELSEYVHLNFQLIQTKMLSEMRRKLNITPNLVNSDGYLSLMVSLYGCMFNELVYGLCGISQSTRTAPFEIVPVQTIQILADLLSGRNPLNGKIRDDVPNDKQKFLKYYQENVDELRGCVEALPK